MLNFPISNYKPLLSFLMFCIHGILINRGPITYFPWNKRMRTTVVVNVVNPMPYITTNKVQRGNGPKWDKILNRWCWRCCKFGHWRRTCSHKILGIFLLTSLASMLMVLSHTLQVEIWLPCWLLQTKEWKEGLIGKEKWWKNILLSHQFQDNLVLNSIIMQGHPLEISNRSMIGMSPWEIDK